MKSIHFLTLGAIFSLSVHGVPVDKFSCQFNVDKDGASYIKLASREFYAPRLPTEYGPPVFEGETADPTKYIPGFKSEASFDWSAPGGEEDFYFRMSVHYAIKKDGSAAAQLSCVGIQGTFHPAPGSGGLSLAITNPKCGYLTVPVWNEDGTLDRYWNPTTLKAGAPVFEPKFLTDVDWTTSHDGHKYKVTASCKYLETLL